MISIEVDYQYPKSEKRKGVCRIIIRNKERSRIITTDVRVYQHEWDDTMKSIRMDNASNDRLKELLKGQSRLKEEIKMLVDIVDYLQINQGDCTLSQIMYERDRWLLKRSFFMLVESRIIHFRFLGQNCTADNYRSALGCFREFRRQHDLALTEVSANLMKEFQKFLQRKGLSMNTISLYNRNLRASYNYALDEELLAEDRRPFRKVFTGVEKTRKRAVKEDVVKRLIALSLEYEPMLDLARDLFLFSIYTQGMSFVDVAHLTTDNLQEERLIYKRSKTHQQLVIELLPCARFILEKYIPYNHGNPYLFPILYNPKKKKPIKYSTALREYNQRLRLISGRLGISRPISSHCARHTWASLAKYNGINEMLISEMMGHNNVKTTAIYLASLDSETTSIANQTIIRSLFNLNQNVKNK